VRQELRKSGKQLVGEAMLTVLATSLNASIKGSLEDFVTKARAELSGFIEAAAQYGEALIFDLAKGLDAIVLSELDAEGNLKAAKAELFEATGKLWRDPLGVFTNVYGAATQFQASVAKASLNLATMAIPKRACDAVLRETAALRRLSPELGRQIRRL
ncbi:hypothetical protein, partial [Burkholderia diffusa]